MFKQIFNNMITNLYFVQKYLLNVHMIYNLFYIRD